MPVCGSHPHNFDHNKCEVFEISKNQWKMIDPYPIDWGSIYSPVLKIETIANSKMRSNL